MKFNRLCALCFLFVLSIPQDSFAELNELLKTSAKSACMAAHNDRHNGNRAAMQAVADQVLPFRSALTEDQYDVLAAVISITYSSAKDELFNESSRRMGPDLLDATCSSYVLGIANEYGF